MPTPAGSSRSGRTASLVGFVTSGGYGHTLGKSLAMAMVNTDLTEPGTELSVHIVGAERAARVIAALAL
jgi:dimethylglycine dehydrogenase